MQTETVNAFAPIAGQIEQLIPKLPGALLTFLIGYLVVRIIQAVVEVGLRTARVNRPLAEIIISILSIVLWAGVAALVFQSLGLTQIALALSGTVAIVALGISSGATKLVSDIVAGVFLAKSRDFKIGQQIKIGDVQGRIYSLDSRKVRIMGDDGTLFILPNTKFDEQMWQIIPEKEEKHGKK